MKKIFLMLAAVLSFTYANSQTNVSGGIFNNTTWTKDKSPYVITADIAVFPGVKLTIEPGVIVKVNDNLKFIVRGELVAKGTIDDTIQFISNSGTPGKSKWVGFQIENDLGGIVQVAYFKGSHADYLFKINSPTWNPILDISNSSLINNNWAIWGSDGSYRTVSLTNSYLYDNNYCFFFCQGSVIENCIFKKGIEAIHSGGVSTSTFLNCEFSEFTESTTRTGGRFNNCKFYNNTNGVKLWPEMDLIDCQIYNNTYGMVLYYSLQPTNFSFRNTCLYDNIIYDVQHLYNYNIDLSGISWKEGNSTVIQSKIYDGYDNVNYGIVKFNESNKCSLLTSVNTAQNASGFKIYPNPFLSQATLQTDVILKDAILTVYNSVGEPVKQFENISGQSVTLDRDNLPDGIYLIRLREGNKILATENILISGN